ncbi:hypothetical protein AMJ40_06140 [candidate division TA06 bacterium DG_26]|uniref:Uncharacterized protein n=1 Tax=candidate division TA06 bacterium DG_26 TaxID=1703771 RepID=A0A0S7WGA1_UNCT6|nr:MAG: hypothetical protein AMJ40_06140 [candidate division TA06 bacterium DG_26]
MLAPPRVEMTVRPRSVENVELTVITGAGEEKMYFRFYIVDFQMNREGKVEYAEPGSLNRSASTWIEMSSREFVMNPAEKRKVKLRLTIPGNAHGGYYSAIILEPLPISAIAQRRTLVHTVRMVSLIELTVEGRSRLREEAVVSDLHIARRSSGRGLTFTATVENRGDLHVRGKGSLIIKSKHGARIEDIALEAGRGTVLPEGSRDFYAVLNKQLSPGEYVAETVVNYGARGRAVSRIPFSVTKGGAVAAGTLDAEREMKFVVDPYMVDITARAGAFRTTAMLVENGEENPIHISVKTRAIAFDPEGAVIMRESLGNQWSCADWVEVEPSEFDLRQRGRRRVRARVTIPREVVGGRAAYIDFVATGAESEGERLEGTAGTILLLTVAGELSIAGEITEVDVSEVGTDQSIDFVVSFKNNGNVHVVPKGKVVITSSSGAQTQAQVGDVEKESNPVVAEAEFDPIMGVVLPEGIRRLTASCPAVLPAGRYSAEVTVTYGGRSPATAQHEFVVR